MAGYDATYQAPGSQDLAGQTGPASSRYGELWVDREPFLQRARRLSRLTITTLFRELGENSTTAEVLAWQSLGAQGVDNLANKLVAAMFPAIVPWLKQSPSPKALKDAMKLDQDKRGEWKAAIEAALAQENIDFLRCISEDGDRPKLYEAAKHLIVGGNHGLRQPRRKTRRGLNTIQSLRLERYVTVRDPTGDLVEFVVDDPMSVMTLPDDIRKMIREKIAMAGQANDGKSEKALQSVSVYTHGKMCRGAFESYQECYGEEVPGSRYTFDPDQNEYMFLRMVTLERENYGRSYVEPYEADLQTLDGNYQSLTEAGAVAAMLKYLVKPGSTINKQALAEAANGAILTGDPDDIGTVQAEKYADMKMVLELTDRIEKRLERGFVMTLNSIRDAERVTKEEVQVVVSELQETVGSVYANLTDTWQRPYGYAKLNRLQKAGRLTPLPKGLVSLTVRSGEEALGDTQAAQALDTRLSTASSLFTPPVLARYIDIGGYLRRQMAKDGTDPDGIVKSQQAVDAELQQEQQQAASQNVAPEVVKQGGQMMQNVQNAHAAAGAAPQQQQQPSEGQQ